MTHATAQAFFQMKTTLNNTVNGDISPLSDKYGAISPSALIHTNLQGIVANDLSYVTNAIVDGAFTPQIGSFRVAGLPNVFSVAIMRTRLKAVGTDLSNGSVSVDLYQGEPTGGTRRRLIFLMIFLEVEPLLSLTLGMIYQWR